MLNFKSFFTLCLVAFIAFGFIIPTEGDEGKSKEKPVKKAVVMYGEETLFATFENLSDEKIQYYYDSLSKSNAASDKVLSQIKMVIG